MKNLLLFSLLLTGVLVVAQDKIVVQLDNRPWTAKDRIRVMLKGADGYNADIKIALDGKSPIVGPVFDPAGSSTEGHSDLTHFADFRATKGQHTLSVSNTDYVFTVSDGTPIVLSKGAEKAAAIIAPTLPTDTIATRNWVRDYIAKMVGAGSGGAAIINPVAPVAPPLAQAPDFVFIANTTGSFDSDDFYQKIYELAPSCRVVRFCIRWDEIVDLSSGAFRSDRLKYRVEWVEKIYRDRGLEPPLFAVDFWTVFDKPQRPPNIPQSEIVKFSNGETSFYPTNTSFFGEHVRNEVARIGREIATWFNINRAGKLYYMTVSTGNTEEFFSPLRWGSSGYTANSDYCEAAQASWKRYCVKNGVESDAVPGIDWRWDSFWAVNIFLRSNIGNHFGKWMAEGQVAFFNAYKNAVKAVNPSIPVIHFIADYYGSQANGWILNSASVYEIVSGCDGLYHSDGDMGTDGGDFGKKYSSFDSSFPTWGNKLYFNEMDYNDMFMKEQMGPSSPQGWAVLANARASYLKGAAGIHYAMSADGDDWRNVNNFNLQILDEVKTGKLKRLDRSNPPTIEFDISKMIFGGNDEIRQKWNEAGGKADNVINIKLIQR